jgi:hypothetical protein
MKELKYKRSVLTPLWNALRLLIRDRPYFFQKLRYKLNF